MRVVIYNIYGFGGTYDYCKYIFRAYSENFKVSDCTLLMPANANMTGANVKKFLLPDIINSKNKWIRRIYYLYRSLINPFKLLMFLRKQPSSIVLFNDFDQHTAFFWAPFFQLMKKKHLFGIYLHDPDRDAFFPWRFLSESSMKRVMSFMDVAFYHGYLPTKKYYHSDLMKVKVPFAVYNETLIDEKVVDRINLEACNFPLLGILGNIRDEKNYEMVIDALSRLNDVKLLIAGQPSNSDVSIEHYKVYAENRKVNDRIIWITEYMPIGAFNAAIQCCEVILLCYKPSFTSQSGILNSIAPFKKKLVISDTKSSLKESVSEYDLGEVIPYDSPSALAEAVRKLLASSKDLQVFKWQKYIESSSWEQHASIVINSFESIQ